MATAGFRLSAVPEDSDIIIINTCGFLQSAVQEAEEVIRAVQRAFRQLGYIATLPDGRLNDATRRAIRKFELDRKLDETGRISGELLAKLASLAGDALQASRQ
jgi:peptidoglycan hydrolase-like protein with peptidoglycan-binding domain